MMSADSVLLCASVLDRSQRNRYEAGLHTKGLAARTIRIAKSSVIRMLAMDVMGYWYFREEFARIAMAHGFEASFADSQVFSYRFHATLRLKSARSLLFPRKTPISRRTRPGQLSKTTCSYSVSRDLERRFSRDSPHLAATDLTGQRITSETKLFD